MEFTVINVLVGVCALIVAAAGNSAAGGGPVIEMQPAGSPPVHMMPHNAHGPSTTYFFPGHTFQLQPIPVSNNRPPPATFTQRENTFTAAAETASAGISLGSHISSLILPIVIHLVTVFAALF